MPWCVASSSLIFYSYQPGQCLELISRTLVWSRGHIPSVWTGVNFPGCKICRRLRKNDETLLPRTSSDVCKTFVFITMGTLHKTSCTLELSVQLMKLRWRDLLHKVNPGWNQGTYQAIKKVISDNQGLCTFRGTTSSPVKDIPVQPREHSLDRATCREGPTPSHEHVEHGERDEVFVLWKKLLLVDEMPNIFPLMISLIFPFYAVTPFEIHSNRN